jgi:hypothetical protein
MRYGVQVSAFINIHPIRICVRVGRCAGVVHFASLWRATQGSPSVPEIRPGTHLIYPGVHGTFVYSEQVSSYICFSSIIY